MKFTTFVDQSLSLGKDLVHPEVVLGVMKGIEVVKSIGQGHALGRGIGRRLKEAEVVIDIEDECMWPVLLIAHNMI